MHWPLRILAIGAASIGFCLDQTWRPEPIHLFSEFLAATPSLADGAVAATRHPYAFHGEVAATSGVIALTGIVLATFLYLGGRREIEWLKALFDFSFSADGNQPAKALAQTGWVRSLHRSAERVGLGWLATRLGHAAGLVLLVISAPLLLGNFISPYKLSFRKFFFDELYHFVIVLPLRGCALLCYTVDRWLVDGLVNAIGRIPPALGSLVRSSQIGLVPFYALAMVLGTLLLIVARVVL
jgi:hypothetical protein